MTQEKLPNDFADDPTKARNIDDANAINEGSLWGMERARHAEQQKQNVEFTLGALVDWVGPENLPTAEELAQLQEETREEKIIDLQYSDEGRKIIEERLAEEGKRLAEAEQGTGDDYVAMWKKHREETRGK